MSTTTAAPTLAGTWALDPTHSKVGFSVKHMGISTVRGEFKEFEGTLEIGEDGTPARAYGTVKTASVDTNQPQRDEHLRAPDFFDVDNHPELRFESTKIERAGEDTFTVTGDLTIHGVTREISLTAEVEGTEIGMQDEERVGLDVTGQLSRSDYDMKFNAALGSGNAVVADRVRLALDIEAVKQA